MPARKSGPQPNGPDRPDTGALILIDAEPYASKRISVELQRGEQLVLSVMSTVPIDIFLCTDTEFHAWARGVSPSHLLSQHDDTTSARLTFRARKTNHLSVVLVNDSDSTAQIGIEAMIMPSAKPVASESNKTRGSLLQVC